MKFCYSIECLNCCFSRDKLDVFPNTGCFTVLSSPLIYPKKFRILRLLSKITFLFPNRINLKFCILALQVINQIVKKKLFKNISEIKINIRENMDWTQYTIHIRAFTRNGGVSTR